MRHSMPWVPWHEVTFSIKISPLRGVTQDEVICLKRSSKPVVAHPEVLPPSRVVIFLDPFAMNARFSVNGATAAELQIKVGSSLESFAAKPAKGILICLNPIS